jgi:hypothetical protein
VNEIHSNHHKNRIYITLKGKVAMDEVIAVIEKIKSEIRSLKPGYSVVSDIVNFIPVNEEARQMIADTMKHMKDNGMGKVVRIISDSPTSQVTGYQWQRTSKSAGYQADTAPSLEEAEKILDQI